MAFDMWEPVYRSILADFGYDRRADERARDLLDALCGPSAEPALDSLHFTGKRVAIAGGAPSLEAEFETARRADVVVAASVAAEELLAAGIQVDCMVTDLDGNPEIARDLSATGTPVAAHAHGDNIPALERHAPSFEQGMLLPTTQAAPVGAVYNFGGFTDGDRAAFLADALGAERLVFPGWEFDDPTVSEVKHRKLVWAERLLYWLERRRGEQFSLLDGRRAAIDTTALPL